MKYLFILFTVFTFGQASNQMVTFTQASTLGFTLNAGQSHVTSNQCMTKSEALAKYNLSTGSMSGFANNQLVPRSAWVSGGSNNYRSYPSISNIDISQACVTLDGFERNGVTLHFEGTTLTNVSLPSVVNVTGIINNIYFNNAPLNGENKWWSVTDGSTTYVFLISPSGVASQREVCSPRTQQFNYRNDPCISIAAMVFLDPNGLFYDSASGGSVLNATLYSYQQTNPPLFLWNVHTFSNGVINSIPQSIESSCAPN